MNTLTRSTNTRECSFCEACAAVILPREARYTVGRDPRTVVCVICCRELVSEGRAVLAQARP